MALLALTWGLIAGSALFIGATIAWVIKPGPAVIATFLSFASGILLAVAAFDLLFEAFHDAGIVSVAIGYIAGAVLFSYGLRRLGRTGVRSRKRISPTTNEVGRASGVVALATVLDGIPESLIIGLSFFHGEGLATATLIAVFLSNIPEGMSSTTRMRLAGGTVSYTYGVFIAVTLVSGLASLLGYLLLGGMPEGTVAVVQAVSGGALIVFVLDTMIPEAFEETQDLAGLAAALGFLVAFSLSHVFT